MEVYGDGRLVTLTREFSIPVLAMPISAAPVERVNGEFQAVQSFRVQLADQRARDIVATKHNARELQRMRADAVKPEEPGSYALGVKWPERTAEEVLSDVGDQIDKPDTANAALQLLVDNVAAGGLTVDAALKVVNTGLGAVRKRRRNQTQRAKASAAPSAPATGGSDDDDASDELSDEVVSVDGSSGSDMELTKAGGASGPRPSRRTPSNRAAQRAKHAATPDAAAKDDGEPEAVNVPFGQLGAYVAAQELGGRLERAPDGVHGSGLDTRKTATEAACCWRKQPECVESNTEEAELYPCKVCRFYFHHKCAVRNGCEADNCCGRAPAAGGLAGCLE